MLSQPTYPIRIDESAIPVELSLVELALVDDSIREGELAFALLPAIDAGALVSRF